jgi:electron-transferring-flavoprotein dehydrogenase
MIVPSKHQPAFPMDRFLVAERPSEEATPVDVLFVGAGPAGLAGAIRLAQLARAAAERGEGPGSLEIGVLEKAASVGEHSLSGAVIDPAPFRELFPDVADADLPFVAPVRAERVYWLGATRATRIPPPREMRNHGNWVGSICDVVRWLGAKAEELGVTLFTGFPAESLLLDGTSVVGVRTTATGLDRQGKPGAGYTPAQDIAARITVLADGTRSPLAEAFRRFAAIESDNPQIYALGVKELWRTKRPLDAVIHTLGWPLPSDAFGGSFFYPMGEDLVALGLVVGLDYRDHSLDVHDLTQRLKTHALFREVLDGGEMVEWGAKTIPEGGFHAVPKRLHGDGVLVVGDAAGLVNVAALKGIHHAMRSGILAADAAWAAIAAGDVSAGGLAAYDRALRRSPTWADLERTRNMRLAFKRGFFGGGVRAFLMDATRGAFPGARIASETDADEPKRVVRAEPLRYDGTTTFSKVDAVFRSGNATRDDIPSHLIVGKDVPPEVAELYQHLCPAGVYERQGDILAVNAPNCVDCKATDVLGPRWTPREGGSGPAYKRM